MLELQRKEKKECAKLNIYFLKDSKNYIRNKLIFLNYAIIKIKLYIFCPLEVH